MGKPSRMDRSLRYAARSTRGFRRGNNEDAAFAGARLLALADGMGGHAAGEVASSVVIAELATLNDTDPPRDIRRELREAVVMANEAIRRRIADEPSIEGMGTTLTAIRFDHDRIGLAHVGDSRAYLLRGGELTQLTKDDTFVQSLVDEGRLTSEEAATHPRRSMVLKAMTGSNIDPYVDVLETEIGDRYLICSDGLTDFVPLSQIEDALQERHPRRAVDRLLQLAMHADSRDNVTVIVADVVEGESGYDIPEITGASGHEGQLVHQ